MRGLEGAHAEPFQEKLLQGLLSGSSGLLTAAVLVFHER